jgi:hypothetical protein
MTVQELLDELKNYNPEAKICVAHRVHGDDDIRGVTGGDDTVYLETV